MFCVSVIPDKKACIFNVFNTESFLFCTGYSVEVIRHNDCYCQTSGRGQPHLHHRQSRSIFESARWSAASHGTATCSSLKWLKTTLLQCEQKENARCLLRKTAGIKWLTFLLCSSLLAWRLQSLLQRPGKWNSTEKHSRICFSFRLTGCFITS